MRSLWKSKEERKRLKRIRDLRRQIDDEIAHIMGHKARTDDLKRELDRLLNWTEQASTVKSGIK